MPRSHPFRFPWRTRRSIAGDVDDEVRFHLDMRAEENVRRGMSPEEARREAERRFGRLTRIKEMGYEVRGGGNRGFEPERMVVCTLLFEGSAEEVAAQERSLYPIASRHGLACGFRLKFM